MIAHAASRLRLTEGQLYTYAIGIVIALVAAAGALPPALHHAKAPASGAPYANTLPATVSSEFVASAPAVQGVSLGLGPPAVAPVAVAAQVAPTVSRSEGVAASSLPPLRAGTITTFTRVGPPGAPSGLARGADGTVYVTTDNGTSRGTPLVPSRVLGFRNDGRPAADVAIDGQPSDHANGLTAAATDPRTGRLVVLDAATNRVVEVDPRSGHQIVLATVPDLAPCFVPAATGNCQPGPLDAAPVPSAAAFDGHGALYVADSGQATIWRLAPGGRSLQIWYQSFDFATGDAPDGIAYGGGGRIAVTAGSTYDVDNPQGGGLYTIALNQDGAPGARTLVAPFSGSDEAGAVAVGASRRTYVVLRGAREVVAVDASGTIAGRYGKRLDRTGGIVVDDGRLLVANQSANNDPRSWQVIAIGMNDGPLH